MSNCDVILLASGRGVRAGKDKILAELGDSNVILRALSRFLRLNYISKIIIVANRDKKDLIKSLTASVKEKQNEIIIPKNKEAILKNLQGLSFKTIIQAIIKGTMKSYKKNKLPYNHYVLKEKSEYEMGFLMQTKMLEIIFLAHLLNVNAFDQPSVEEYKIETKKILKI